MNQLKTLIFNRFNTFIFLTACILISTFLLMLRIKLTHSFFLIFLVWNLFLAIIPYAISLFLENKKNTPKLSLIACSVIWLLFLPNAPYIFTDFIHLRISPNHLLWIDLIVITSFALTGFAFYFLSIIGMLKTFSRFLKNQHHTYILWILYLLSSFGVYLGRFLRYNSWEILQNPLAIIKDITSIVFYPLQNQDAWFFTISFALFLAMGFWVTKKIIPQPQK